MKPEARARQKIDQLLAAAGWNVQHFEELNLSAALGVAVREFRLKSGFAEILAVNIFASQKPTLSHVRRTN